MAAKTGMESGELLSGMVRDFCWFEDGSAWNYDEGQQDWVEQDIMAFRKGKSFKGKGKGKSMNLGTGWGFKGKGKGKSKGYNIKGKGKQKGNFSEGYGNVAGGKG